jgi:hypothetical protein
LKCEQALDVLAGLPNHEQSATFFPARSSLITRARLLLRQGKWREATSAANAAIEESQKVVDRATLATALMLRAQATANDGQRDEASRSVCSASLAGAWGIREHLGMFAQVYSRIQQPGSPLGLQSCQRALRIWR